MQSPESSRRPVVLIVDDDHVMRLLERETLGQFEFDVREVADGEEALQLLDEFVPDLVLLDVDMPGVDGFEIGRQKLNEERIRRLAYFDTLTGMPNRQNFVERLDGQLLHARREHHQVALLFLHLDDSKRVNDTLGHTAGDYLLHAVADRLKEKLRGSDFIARPALDETGVNFARLDGDAIKRLALENDLREGLEHDEFHLVYQPQVLAEGGAIESILMDTDPSRIEGLARLRAQGCISRWTTSAPATCHCPASSASRSAC